MAVELGLVLADATTSGGGCTSPELFDVEERRCSEFEVGLEGYLVRWRECSKQWQTNEVDRVTMLHWHRNVALAMANIDIAIITKVSTRCGVMSGMWGQIDHALFWAQVWPTIAWSKTG
jgi:hypothetical protein